MRKAHGQEGADRGWQYREEVQGIGNREQKKSAERKVRERKDGEQVTGNREQKESDEQVSRKRLVNPWQGSPGRGR